MPSTDEAAHRFDHVASQWDANPMRVAMARAVADTMRATVPFHGGMQVLDFGCGTGLLTLALLPHVGAVTATDASREMLRILEGKLSASGIQNVRVLHGDIASIPLESAAFDLVASSMVLHHVRDVPSILVRLRRCLRPGGWIAVADLDAEDGTFHSDMTGVCHRGFARPVVAAWLEQAGFTDAKVRDAHQINRDARQYGVFLASARA